MRRTRGFTLIELVVVLAIIIMLVSLMLPMIERTREKARQTVCLNNQRNIALSITMFTQDNEDTMPDAKTVWSDVQVHPEYLLCPTVPVLKKQKKYDVDPRSAMVAGRQNDYFYSSFVAGRALTDIKLPHLEPLTVDGAFNVNPPDGTTNGWASHVFYVPSHFDPRHNGNYANSYCDGHVEMHSEPPPMWSYALTNAHTFDREVTKAKYPTLVIFTGFHGSMSVDNPERVYSYRIGEAIASYCRRYRLKLKVVELRDDRTRDRKTGKIDSQWSDLAHRLGIGSYPAFLLYMNGHRVWTKTDYESRSRTWTEARWEEEITDMKDELNTKLKELCHVP